ncbi:MAG: hypothetical protein A2231_06825 [Candidatus Firestonebacteria bacterium RIFOXYA2_FULL_40_8]|nr:MAG: hypothetical protein A2231_06825 [Candidatus Firestonebacteria bacterium RIFOXYA2_FULL_40_8]
MITGKEIRLSKIFGADGKAVIVACDHGMHMMPLDGIRNMFETSKNLKAADGVLVSPGNAKLLKDFFKGKNAPAMIIRGDTLTGVRDVAVPEFDGITNVIEPEDVLRLGGMAILMSHIIGFEDTRIEAASIERVAKTCRKCEILGLPVIVEAAPFGRKLINDPLDGEIMKRLCRSSMEYGADVIKTLYTDNFKEIVKCVQIPMLVLGGGKSTEDGTYNLVDKAMKAGAKGVVIGRNITQAKNPEGFLGKIIKRVH